MKNIYLFQPQYTVHGNKSYWIPYSIGCIWSFAQQYEFVTDNFTLANLFFKRDNIDELIKSINEPAICGFSCYAWNEQYCLTAAEYIKQKWPNCIIIFGGPQTNISLLVNNFIDVVVTGEGEENFTDFLRDVLDNNVKEIYTKRRLTDLAIPNPYTTGIFDKIIADNPGAIWSATLETNRGCPYACTFCDWGSATYSKVRKYNIEDVAGTIDWISKNPITYVFIADANFGIFKERDLAIAKMLGQANQHGGMIESVDATYAKNSSEYMFIIAKELGNLSSGITISVQSMNKKTLEAVKRKNMDINDIAHMMSLSKIHNITAYTELIIGLPEETLESWKDGLCELLELGQHNKIDIYPALTIRNSELNSFDMKIKYGIKTMRVPKGMTFATDLESEIPEETFVINKTQTMSTDEMITAYMWGVMISTVHCFGYSQIVAKYCRMRLGIPYRDFYNKLFEDMYALSYIKELHTEITQFYTTGESTLASHNPMRGGFTYLFNNKKLIFDLVKQCSATFISKETDLDNINKIQQYFINDPAHPAIFISPWNLQTWDIQLTTYQIPYTNIDVNTPYNNRLRSNGIIKNTFIEVIADPVDKHKLPC